ncbi:hypothetical protein EMIHUDRAFT_201586 [Emiliania huxleyi CCMP1516]|uniref:Mediator of RNA polymerase II transcription subunit 20 n=2 Tax=Emiliania huxleyi TaxID=2903 RepID=A0A0D3KI86_EMIH1|nr:hypothetical protein EMIHUDRAFT_201586 [Emiliania huxleyi CCMP1516]EOD35471.1 hypothetical protein EMIHUDRAFT_201586 [Emiliania huxleyi CCMP1516]|eukprot:XP_005787900.1 hypothetical protein EMIHUDRAFT_201586 [Emiliania huxleyi CCMP1516]
MGVCALVHLPGAREAALSARLSAIGCTRAGRWRTHCLYFKPKVAAAAPSADAAEIAPTPPLEPPLEEVCVLHYSERPEVYFVCRAGTVQERLGDLAGVEACTLGESTLGETHSQRLRITAEGAEFRFGDFIVRLGGLFLNASVGGTVVEAEYLPCSRAGCGEAVLKDFLSSDGGEAEAELGRRYAASQQARKRLVEEEALRVQGERRAVRVLVAGPPAAARRVLLLHGYGSKPETWAIVGALDRLAERGVRAVAPELPEISERAVGAEAAAETSDRRTFVARLLEALGWGDRKVAIVAASAGGSFATPYVLAPATHRNVSCYLSLAAQLDRSGDVAPRKSRPPTLLVWGALDNAFPSECLAAQQQYRFFAFGDVRNAREDPRRSQWVVLPGAPHAVHVASPERFCSMLLQLVLGTKSEREKVTVTAEWGDVVATVVPAGGEAESRSAVRGTVVASPAGGEAGSGGSVAQRGTKRERVS